MHRKWQINLKTYSQAEESWLMANKDHLARLKQGVEAWNQWRGELKVRYPELQGADLCAANLTGADLSKLDFCPFTRLAVGG